MSIFEDRPASHQTLVFNGVETAEYRPENAQASIYGNEPGSMRYAIASVDYLCGWPFFYRSVEGQPTPELKVEQDNGLLRVELTRPQSRIEQSIDAKTAFLYHYLSASDNGSGTETWQFAPHELPGGGMLAGLSARFSYTAQRIVAHITVLQDADLTPPPASAFALPAPSGTNVVDFRGNQQRPKSSVTSEPVPDVVARANAIADDHRSILPVVQVGQPAPALKPVSWLTASGKCEAPDLKGKVVLVDFWGTNCGFCIVQLPDVQAAHKRLASKGLVIVGMHDAGGEVEAVAQLAKKHGLTYLLAIDRPAEGRGFGAICESYGIRGIPNCAVIDQAGKVAFVGDFLTAAYAAEKLLAVK
jgi:peroxiredoxin